MANKIKEAKLIERKKRETSGEGIAKAKRMLMAGNMRRVNFYLDIKDLVKLKMKIAARGISMTELFKEWVKNYVHENK